MAMNDLLSKEGSLPKVISHRIASHQHYIFWAVAVCRLFSLANASIFQVEMKFKLFIELRLLS
jgi:hypothetical protein